jgi:DHA2 family multidrug resistance protein
MLDKGQDADWFSAIWMRWFTVICVLCFIGFIVRELTAKNPLVDLSVFKNRNFAVSCGLFGLFGFALYALITLQPLFVQSLLGYSAFDAGFSVSPRGSARLSRCFLSAHWWAGLIRGCWPDSASRRSGWPVLFCAG